VASELRVDDSVSINGVCQTVVRREEDLFTVVAVEETLLKTTIGSLRALSRVNLELAMKLGDRLGGHLVSGHVDCVGQVESIEQREASWLFRILIPAQFNRYVISVGSIAIDGVSLTVASVEGNTVAVSIIPHTMENTIFASYKPNSHVNLEFDMIGKYIERFVGVKNDESGKDSISTEQLKNWGYGV
jgi:riboflavin synthase